MPTDILNSFKKDPPWAGVEESALAPIPTTTVGVTVTPLTGPRGSKLHIWAFERTNGVRFMCLNSAGTSRHCQQGT